MKLNRLKEIFDERGVKNRILALHLKKSESTISLWRNNRRQPSVEEFYQIAKLLRIDIRTLFEETLWYNECSETYEDLQQKK